MHDNLIWLNPLVQMGRFQGEKCPKQNNMVKKKAGGPIDPPARGQLLLVFVLRLEGGTQDVAQ